MKEKLKKKCINGFSLVELLVAIAIMAVLTGVLSPILLSYVERARENRDAAAIGEFIDVLYITASDLDNWYGITGTMKFEYDSSSESLKMTPDIGDNLFSQEVSTAVGGDIKLVSKKWKAADLVISVSPVWDTIHVSGNLPAGYDFANCTIE